MSTARVKYVRCVPKQPLRSSILVSDLENRRVRTSIRQDVPVYISSTQPFTDFPLTDEVLQSYATGSLRGYEVAGLVDLFILESEDVTDDEATLSSRFVKIDSTLGPQTVTLPWPVPSGTAITFIKISTDANDVEIEGNPEGGSLLSPILLSDTGASITLFLDEDETWQSLGQQGAVTSAASSYLPIVELWVNNVTGLDDPTAGSKNSPCRSIRYAMDRLKPLGVGALKIINIMYTGTTYRDTIICNTSFWHIRGIDNPSSSPDTGGLQRIVLNNEQTGPFAVFPPVIITNLTDGALNTFYTSPSFPMYNETDTNMEWVGPDLTVLPTQDSTLVDITSPTSVSMHVLIENILVNSDAGVTRNFSGTTAPDRYATFILGKSPTYPTNLYGGIQLIAFNRYRSARGCIIKNATTVSFESSLDFGSLWADNTRGISLIDPKPFRTLKTRLGNTNASTTEVFLTNPATVTNAPLILTESPLVVTGSTDVGPVRGGSLKMVGAVNLSGLFGDSSYGQVQTGVQFGALQNSYIGGHQALAKTIQTSGVEPIPLDLVGNLTVAENGTVAGLPCRIKGTLTLTTARACQLASGKVVGETTLNGGAGVYTFEDMIFDSNVTVNSGTVNFINCTIRGSLTVNNGAVTLTACAVQGPATLVAGSGTVNISSFQSPFVTGPWVVNGSTI